MQVASLPKLSRAPPPTNSNHQELSFGNLRYLSHKLKILDLSSPPQYILRVDDYSG